MKGLFFVALFGFFILVVMGAKQSKLEAQSQRPIPIGRYEFPQDGVVCYRTSYGSYWGSLSCVKK